MISQQARWNSMFYIGDGVKRMFWRVDRNPFSIGDPVGRDLYGATRIHLGLHKADLMRIAHVMLYGYAARDKFKIIEHRKFELSESNIRKDPVEGPNDCPHIVINGKTFDVYYLAPASYTTKNYVNVRNTGFESPYEAYLHMCTRDKGLFGPYWWNFHCASMEKPLPEDHFMELFETRTIKGIRVTHRTMA